MATNENNRTHYQRGRLTVEIEPGFGEDGIVIHVRDDIELLGRVLIDPVAVEIWQPNDLNGPMFEWVGLLGKE